MSQLVVDHAELPTNSDFVVDDSSFSQHFKCGLPAPQVVRLRAALDGHTRWGDPRPDPVRFEELGLLVKWGSYITTAEGQCLWYFNRHLKGEVPVPEVYGWCTDQGETFLYMELVDADNLEQRWPELSDDERRSICDQLSQCVSCWRGLRQPKERYFLGSINGRGLQDIIFYDVGHADPGPFMTLSSFHDFFAKLSCRLNPLSNPRSEIPELAGMKDNQAIVFTHGDLDRSNILISKSHDSPRLVAVIDWHQSGWYPRDWEWLKAQWVAKPGDSAWVPKWVSRFIAPADDDYWYAWEYICHCIGP